MPFSTVPVRGRAPLAAAGEEQANETTLPRQAARAPDAHPDSPAGRDGDRRPDRNAPGLISTDSGRPPPRSARSARHKATAARNAA